MSSKEAWIVSVFVPIFALMVPLAASAAEAAEDFSAMRGANFVPSYARNDVALWMDYDPAVVDRELGYAERLQLNTIRIFLNQAVYEQDPGKFMERLENFLSLCEKHKLRVMPVLFDSCFDPQTVDLKTYREKNWMPGPGFSRLGAKDRPAMEDYIHAVVGKYKEDRRIVLWDVMNEPENTAAYKNLEPGGGRQTVDEFVRWSLRRVREEKPTQPLTIGWMAPGSSIAAIDLVDVICIHLYGPHQTLKQRIELAQHWGRLYGKPVILNEFVGRPAQRIEQAIPIAAKQKIGWVFWELMLGKTQFTQGARPFQGHIYPDGTCYSAKEVATILHPEGFTGDPVAIAEKAGFKERFREPLRFDGITFNGIWERWNGRGPNRDRLAYSTGPDDTATKKVSGSTITLVLKHGPDCGIATVTVDGKPASVAEIDTYSKETDWNRRTVVASELTPGEHTVIITATGRKSNAASSTLVQVVDIVGEK